MIRGGQRRREPAAGHVSMERTASEPKARSGGSLKDAHMGEAGVHMAGVRLRCRDATMNEMRR